MMASLGESAKTPIIFLVAAGAIMVFSLATSKKARKVVQTEVGLSRKNEGDEMFGSSKVARSLVRFSNSVAGAVLRYTPMKVRRYVDSRFQIPEDYDDNGAAYDMCRASVNLCVASLLIALGTSLKLPLSTTFVTFMVAMGSSLADRAWSRESAVFRITGVLTVIGGWFITAGVAFTACFAVAMAMRFGGVVAVVVIVVAGLYSIIHSQQRFAKKEREENEGEDVLFQQMITAKDRSTIVPMLTRHMDVSVAEEITKYADWLKTSTDALFAESLRPMRHTMKDLNRNKRELKNLRRRETICLRRALPPIAGVKLSTSFHLVHNGLRQMLYGLIRIVEPACEHVDNNFMPIPSAQAERFCSLRNRFVELALEMASNFRNLRTEDNEKLLAASSDLRKDFDRFCEDVGVSMQNADVNLNSATLLLHMVRETQQLVVELEGLISTDNEFHKMVK